MKYCSENEKTHKLIDEELNETEKLAFEKHLSVCPECRDLYDSTRQTRTLLLAQPPVLPDNGFDNRMLRLIEEKTEKKAAKVGFLSVFSGFSLKLGFAALIAAAALGLAFQLGRMSAFSSSQNDLTQISTTEKESNPATEKTIVLPPTEKIVTQVRTVTKYIQVPVIKKVREEKIVYAGNSKSTEPENAVSPKQKNEIREEIIAKQFNLKDLQPVSEASYRIIRKGENNEE